MDICYPREISRKRLYLTSGIVFVISLCVGILIGAFGTQQPGDHRVAAAGLKEDVTQAVLSQVNAKNIDDDLRYLTSVPHVAGTPQDLEQANWVRDRFLSYGFDKVQVVPYNVLLSYPDLKTPNKVYLLDSNGSVNFSTSGRQKPIFSAEESDERVMPSFNAYSGTGTVTGDVVYAYYGRPADFEVLLSRGIDVKGKIVLARLGKIYRGNIVRNSQQRGASGVIMYGDPKDFAPQGRDNVYPKSWWMPGSAVQSGTLSTRNGDPLTPFLPAIESAYRIPESEAEIPRIPVQSISYDEAEVILRSMVKTHPAPPEWQGNLDVPYYLGPGLAQPGWTVKLEVHTANKMATTYNTIGFIYGQEEPDRYVLLGNHRDAWIFGAQDPSSGTATMMEVARVFGTMKKERNWRPRRTLVFCSWGAEEYIIIGSYEWVEEHLKVLSQRAVAYLNIDTAIEGNFSLAAYTVPMLRDLVVESAKQIPNPDHNEVLIGRKTVYDTWLARVPDPANPNQPRVGTLGSGSDFAPFIHTAGIPSVDFFFDYRKDVEMYQYPLYHTLYETYHAAKVLDPNTDFLLAVGRLWSLMALRLSDSAVLPLDVDSYPRHLKKGLDTLKLRYEQKLQANNATFRYFEKAIQEFEAEASDFTARLAELDTSNPLAVRAVNDQLIQLERAFIDPKGLPNSRQFSHIVFAPSSSNVYASSSFAGFTDLMEEIGSKTEAEEPKLWSQVKEHLALIAFYIQAAGASLKDDM